MLALSLRLFSPQRQMRCEPYSVQPYVHIPHNKNTTSCNSAPSEPQKQNTPRHSVRPWTWDGCRLFSVWDEYLVGMSGNNRRSDSEAWTSFADQHFGWVSFVFVSVFGGVISSFCFAAIYEQADGPRSWSFVVSSAGPCLFCKDCPRCCHGSWLDVR